MQEFQMPNLSNATPEFLVDELGTIRDNMKAEKKYEGVLKAAIKARKEDDDYSINGEVYVATFTNSARASVSGPKVKELIDPSAELTINGIMMTGAEFLEKVTLVSDVETLRTSLRD